MKKVNWKMKEIRR